MRRKLLLLALLCGLLPGAGRAQTTTLVNPILAGFYPDPSVVKVGADYYLVNSTFAYFPGIPIFHSRDLKNWEQVGNVISRPSQMNFVGDRLTRGLFAPAIDYHNGTFYLTCTQIDHRGNFVVTAKNPAGPWSNPTFLPEVRGIDPSLFFDDASGKAYIIYNGDPPGNQSLYPGHRSIKQYEFDPVQLRVVGEERLLVNGGVDLSKKPVWIEGPHLLHTHGWYYLYAAEGGTSVNHSEVVFRSQSPLGPFVPYEHNPILTQRDLPKDRKDPITSAGHAQLVQGPDGQTYAIFLAVRPYEDNYYNTGRETFIAPVAWQDDWPIINPSSKEIKCSYQAPYPEVKLPGARPQTGNFSYTSTFDKPLDLAWLFLRTRDSSSYALSKTAGLTLKLKPETCAGTGNPAFVGRRQQHLHGSAETELTFAAKSESEQAGLVVLQDEHHFYYLCQSVAGGKPVVQLFKSGADKQPMELLAQQPLGAGAGKVRLRVRAEGDTYGFDVVEGPKASWRVLKDQVDARFLSTQVAGGFIGCLYGLYATSSGQSSSNSAAFKYLRYEGYDGTYSPAPAAGRKP